MARIEQRTNGLWYVVLLNPRYSHSLEMGGYATEDDAKEMRDFLVKELTE